MTGCLATAYGPRELGAETPKIDSHGEIENARWFEVEEIIEAIVLCYLSRGFWRP